MEPLKFAKEYEESENLDAAFKLLDQRKKEFQGMKSEMERTIRREEEEAKAAAEAAQAAERERIRKEEEEREAQRRNVRNSPRLP